VSRNAGRAVIGGGRQNYIDSTTPYAVIGGGLNNRALNLALYSTIGGGWDNLIGVDSESALVAGGRDNQIQESAGAAILGGQHHRIWPFAYQAVIAGGLSNQAAGPQSFAAGTRARALHGGSFVWGDSSTGTVDSTAVNQTTFRASTGGFRVFTSAAATSGVTLAANAGSWTSISDVNAKEAFAPVDTRAVLDQVAALPITTWRYKGQAEEIRHIGPTAQDFHAAFRVGDAPGYGITAVDADGVALAAIQALAEEDRRQRTEDGGRQERITRLELENAELKAKTEELEARLRALEAR
jgi:hypothetical protein